MSKLAMAADSVISHHSIKSVAPYFHLRMVLYIRNVYLGTCSASCSSISSIWFLLLVTYYEAECTLGPFVTVLSVTFQTLLQAVSKPRQAPISCFHFLCSQFHF